MHFNSKVCFDRVVFERDAQTGYYKHLSKPWDINFEKVESYSHGELRLDDGEVVLVEQDYEQIKKLIDDKLKEQEVYSAHLRMQESNGVVFLPEGDE